MTEEELKKYYVLAQIRYQSIFGNIYENIYPNDWYSTTNYELKIRIISEAIKTNQLIKDTKLYRNSFIPNQSLRTK